MQKATVPPMTDRMIEHIRTFRHPTE